VIGDLEGGNTWDGQIILKKNGWTGQPLDWMTEECIWLGDKILVKPLLSEEEMKITGR